jgi:SPP1 gp7 family putative phage head morphogenesis protein
MCGYCDVENNYKEPLNLFTEEDYDRLIQGIAAGLITTQKLDFNTYRLIARKLSEGVFSGFGMGIDDVVVDSTDYRMLFDLRKNVYVFAGAKTYQETREISSLLTLKYKNEIRSFSDFRKKAMEILVKYNDEWLSAEYDCAIKSSRSASQWMQFKKDSMLYPMLTYHTVGDSRVRPQHAELNAISRPTDDKFWDNYMPPNGWRCRCTVLQGDDQVEKTNLQGFRQPKDVPDIFMMNPGAYAKRNFNLSLP